jgi:aldose 1-epimerase
MRTSDVDGLRARTLRSPDGELEATFVPGAGMLCCSLRHDGVELLAQRDGVRAYAERGSTMGVPLLYPWANRLAAFDYPGPRGTVALRRDDPLLTLDPNGLPIHGALPGALPWELLDAGADGGAESLRARLRWEREDLLAIFPWRHEVQMRASVSGATLTIETTVRADERAAADALGLPVSFGFHPYLAPPGGERTGWEVTLPVDRHLLLDGRMIPTGASEPLERRRFALDDGDWDDAYAGVLASPPFELAAGGTRIELEPAGGYAFAQLYAPRGERFVCFEPMTAPTNALRSGDRLTRLAPGGTFAARFAIGVTGD